jgi:pyridinium-3,5-bisthiocarboxylic acid mononucleotide nickel chelatase
MKSEFANIVSPTATRLDSNLVKTRLHFEKDVIAVLETNVDDVTGEILGRTVERLMSEGAYDATVTTNLGKKGRIEHTVRAVCSRDLIEKFAQIIVEETGTLGVKTSEYTRLIVPRKTVSVPFKLRDYKGNVTVKVAEIGGQYRIKPEVAEAKAISDASKVPLRSVLEAITASAKEFLESERARK